MCNVCFGVCAMCECWSVSKVCVMVVLGCVKCVCDVV